MKDDKDQLIRQEEVITAEGKEIMFHDLIHRVDDVVKFISDMDKTRKEIESYRDEMKKAKGEVFGYTEKKTNGEEVIHKGYRDQMGESFQEYEVKIKSLTNQVESLLSGATTISLSSEFEGRVKEYKNASMGWQVALIAILSLAITCFIGYNFFLLPVLVGQEWLFSFLRQVPIIALLTWLVVFIGNRRAENKKLEEAYTHKVVIAKTFTGYQKSIAEFATTKEMLLSSLMGNLLGALGKDPSDFLSSKGENPPAVDAASNYKMPS